MTYEKSLPGEKEGSQGEADAPFGLLASFHGKSRSMNCRPGNHAYPFKGGQFGHIGKIFTPFWLYIYKKECDRNSPVFPVI